MEAVSRLSHNSEQIKWNWHQIGSLGYGWTFKDADSDKIAIFDMDRTIIRTKTFREHPIGINDWMFWDPTVPSKLKQVKDKGYRVVIVTNQKRLSQGHTTLNEIQSKIEDFSNQIGIEMSAFIATSDDEFRKPLPGIWNFILDKHNTAKIDKDQCFIVGDASVRANVGYRRKHKHKSDADRIFAINCGLAYYTPEHFFLGKKVVLLDIPLSIVQLHKASTLFKGKAYEFDASKRDSIFISC